MAEVAEEQPTAVPSWTTGPVPAELAHARHLSALVQADNGQAIFSLPSVGRFWVRPGRPTVVEPAAGAGDDDVECMLRGPVGALRSTLAGRYCLRGSAVAVAGQALVLVGSLRGASTLAAALARRGHPLLADGVVVITGSPATAGPLPEGAPPRVALWPDSARALGLAPGDGRPVRPSLPARRYEVGPPAPAGPLPLRVLIVLLDEAAAAAQRRQGHGAGRAGGRFVSLRENEWHASVVADLGHQLDELAWATPLCSAPPFAWQVLPAELSSQSLGQLAEQVLELVT